MKDANGIGLGVVSGGNVVSSAGGAILPASAASSTTNYWLGGGTSSRTVTASEAGNSLSIIPGAAGQGLTIGAGTLGLTANLMSFDGTKYPYSINGPGQLGTGAAILTLNTAGSNALTIAAPISSGSGGLAVIGCGTVILTASNAFSGDTTVGASATLQIGGAGVLGRGNYSGAISNNGALIVNTSRNQTFSGVISNNGALVVNASGNQMFNGVISGTVRLYQLGSGVTSLVGSNTYSGLTTVAEGTLKLGNTAALGNSPGVNISNGGALDINGLNMASLNEPISVSGAVRAAAAQSSTAAPPTVGEERHSCRQHDHRHGQQRGDRLIHR